jgi:hypothetical protein
MTAPAWTVDGAAAGGESGMRMPAETAGDGGVEGSTTSGADGATARPRLGATAGSAM